MWAAAGAVARVPRRHVEVVRRRSASGHPKRPMQGCHFVEDVLEEGEVLRAAVEPPHRRLQRGPDVGVDRLERSEEHSGSVSACVILRVILLGGFPRQVRQLLGSLPRSLPSLVKRLDLLFPLDLVGPIEIVELLFGSGLGAFRPLKRLLSPSHPGRDGFRRFRRAPSVECLLDLPFGISAGGVLGRVALPFGKAEEVFSRLPVALEIFLGRLMLGLHAIFVVRARLMHPWTMLCLHSVRALIGRLPTRGVAAAIRRAAAMSSLGTAASDDGAPLPAGRLDLHKAVGSRWTSAGLAERHRFGAKHPLASRRARRLALRGRRAAPAPIRPTASRF